MKKQQGLATKDDFKRVGRKLNIAIGFAGATNILAFALLLQSIG